MSHYRVAESKREEFRRYLEKSGVLDTITSVLVQLYEENDKPDNALEYPFSHMLTLAPGSFIKAQLNGAGPDPVDSEALRMELADLQQKCNLLMGENKELRNRLMQYEPLPDAGPAK